MSTTTTPAAPKPGTPEHDAAMAAKFDSTTTPAATTPAASATAPTKPQRPDTVPEKFWDADKGEVRVTDLLKSYTELEKKGSQKPTEPATTPAAATTPATTPDPNAAPATTPEAAKVDLNAAAEEFLKDGKLSDATYAALAKAGIDKAQADVQMAGVQALQQQYTAKAHARVGDEKQYEQMITWAGSNLTPAEITAFDAAVGSGNEAQMLMAIDAVKAKFVAANGQAPTLLGGERPTGNVGTFRDKSEMTAAMKDPRYKTSPAYRKDVEAKIAGMKGW